MTDFARSIGNAVIKRVGRVAGRFQEQRPLASDLLESEDEYLVIFDAPGALASDVDVRYEKGAVRVTVDRFRDYHEGYSMRFPGRGLALDGRRRLPEDAIVDAESARARLTSDGTLTVFLPKRDAGLSEVSIEEPSESADPEEGVSGPHNEGNSEED
jgi:HSP20 family protein